MEGEGKGQAKPASDQNSTIQEVPVPAHMNQVEMEVDGLGCMSGGAPATASQKSLDLVQGVQALAVGLGGSGASESNEEIIISPEADFSVHPSPNVGDVVPAHQLQGNLYEYPNIVKLLKMNAGVEELKLLRQISTQYHHQISTDYFDKLNKYGKLELRQIEGERVWVLQPPVPPDGAHIFRKLDVDFPDDELSDESESDESKKILKSLGPHVQKFKIICCDNYEYNASRLENCVQLLKELFELLTNLSYFEFDGFGFVGCPVNSTNGLRELFELLPESVQITIHLNAHAPSWIPISHSYPPTIPNLFPCRQVQIKLRTRIFDELDFNEQLNHLNQMSDFYKMNNISFYHFSFRPGVNAYDFDNNQAQILDAFEGLMSTNRNMNLSIILYFAANPEKFNLLGPLTPTINEWGQNITLLYLVSYCNPTQIEYFPNLIKLTLVKCDVNACLLTVLTTNDQEVLTQRFQGKHQLAVRFDNNEDYVSTNISRIQPGNPLAVLIQTFVRKLEFNNWVEVDPEVDVEKYFYDFFQQVEN